MEVLERRLSVMDLTAISLAMDNSLLLNVFNLKIKGNIRRVICGETIGTRIYEPEKRLTVNRLIDEGVMMIEDINNEAKDRMGKTIGSLKGELRKVRTGRASLNVFDDIRVDYYGTQTPLNQMATLAVPESPPDHDSALGCFRDQGY